MCIIAIQWHCICQGCIRQASLSYLVWRKNSSFILFYAASFSFSGSRTSSILSEAESEFKRESIIVQSPLPVIYEGKEIELTFSNLTEENEHVMEDDSEEEESVFGSTVVESIMTIKVNPGAISDD